MYLDQLTARRFTSTRQIFDPRKSARPEDHVFVQEEQTTTIKVKAVSFPSAENVFCVICCMADVSEYLMHVLKRELSVMQVHAKTNVKGLFGKGLHTLLLY